MAGRHCRHDPRTGLRREEVAHLSGVSVDYYGRLEQGRATQPSEQVLDALARVLGLDETERGHLYRLARQHRRRAKAPGGRVRPELLRVLDLVSDACALIMNHRLDVLAGNRLAGLLLGRPMPGRDDADRCRVCWTGRILRAAGCLPTCCTSAVSILGLWSTTCGHIRE